MAEKNESSGSDYRVEEGSSRKIKAYHKGCLHDKGEEEAGVPCPRLSHEGTSGRSLGPRKEVSESTLTMSRRWGGPPWIWTRKGEAKDRGSPSL